MLKSISLFLLMLCSAQAGCIEYHEYASPDKRYVAQLTRADREIVLVIKNQITKKEEFSTTTLIPAVQCVQWSPDSQSLLIVAHISGGSLGTIIHHDTCEWKRYECDPPLQEPYYYFLVGVKFLPKAARLTYGLFSSRGSSISEQKICIFDVEYKTGLIALKKLGIPSKKDVEKLDANEKRKWNMWETQTADKEMKSPY